MDSYVKQLEKRVEDLERINAALEFHNMLLVGTPSSVAGDIIEICCCYKNDKKPDIISHFIDAGKWEHSMISKIVAVCVPKLIKGDDLIDTISISKKRIYRARTVSVWQVDFGKKKKNWYLTNMWRGSRLDAHVQIPIKSKSIGMKINWVKNDILTQVNKELKELNKARLKWKMPI